MLRLLFAALLAAPLVASADTRLLRFPTAHGENVVFTYAGDLYTAPIQGGIARRLTSHDGFEMFARFSPDGKHIAFTGQYDGNTEIYVIPAAGGEPKRLTYTATLGRDDVSDRMGPNNICMGWTPDGKHIVFRSRMHSFNDFLGALYTVPVEGGLAEQLPLPRGGFCSYSPDGSKLAYNRVFREFRTWKRYRGGMSDDVWIYDFKTKVTTQFTKDPAQDIQPMWAGEWIYFVSDREKSGRLNLYKAPAKGGDATKITNFQDFDVKFPSLGDKYIVFEQGGWIWKLNLENDKAEKLTIRILEDRVGARTQLHPVGKEVTNYEISPDGSHALFGARGDVFVVPAKTGATRNLTNTPGVHERNSKWSPDGKYIAYISDKSGEDEVWICTADGKIHTQLTKNGDTYKYELNWSPDSTKILWTDKKLRIAYVHIVTKNITGVIQSPVWEVRDAVWSPDSKWIAWSQQEPNGMSDVYVHSVEKGENLKVTESRHNNSQPCFSGDGKVLFFVSARDFNPIYSATEWNHAYQNMSRIYAVMLTKDTPSPFAPKQDEAKKPEAKEKDKEPAKKDEKPGTAKPSGVTVKIDTEGLTRRIIQLPVKPGNYRNLQSVGSSVYYVGSGGMGVYDLSAKKDTNLGQIGGYEISADGKKMIVSAQGKHAIIDLPRAPVTLGEGLNLSGMEVRLDRKAEWKQIYHECWRQMRDFFYDPNMHGVDWKGLRDRYEPLVEHVSHRADLTYIIGELISELNAGHAYVGGGDMPRPKRLPLGLLGAKLKAAPDTKAVQIEKVLRGSSWDPALKSPLAEPGLDVKDGEWILAIDGTDLKDVSNMAELLINKVGKEVKLTLASTSDGKESRTVTVLPIASEADLYYYDWVEGNLEKVSKATDGKVGYLHVPDMLQTGLNQFAKYYYPQLTKQALIVDMRGNGGGNVSPMLIERLRREAIMITIARNSQPRFDPPIVQGPMCCLMNEFSASDGDLFPFRFRAHGLGKLIGKRSWGGVVGIRGTLPLLDGGTLNRPEFSRYDLEGKEWIIEGKGVSPDIEVGNDPAKEFAGEDEQLNVAIRHMLEEMKTKQRVIPPPPAGPIR
jgi:tricorn protease